MPLLVCYKILRAIQQILGLEPTHLLHPLNLKVMQLVIPVVGIGTPSVRAHPYAQGKVIQGLDPHPQAHSQAKGLAGGDPGWEPSPHLPYKLGGDLTMPFPLVCWQVIKCNLKFHM